MIVLHYRAIPGLRHQVQQAIAASARATPQPPSARRPCTAAAPPPALAWPPGHSRPGPFAAVPPHAPRLHVPPDRQMTAWTTGRSPPRAGDSAAAFQAGW
jgi:hypothetical protein